MDSDLTAERCDLLLDRLSQTKGPIWILMHDYPDPDCLAAALGMLCLVTNAGNDAWIVYGGGMGRPANKAMAGLLQMPIHLLGKTAVPDPEGVILVDTQPGTGNNSLDDGHVVLFVLDHHVDREPENNGQYRDIRPEYGSTSTLLYEYLRYSKASYDASVATALALGILTDTDGLARDATPYDIDAYSALLPMVDLDVLRKVLRPPLSDDYFIMLNRALRRAVRYGEAIVSNVGEVPEPDLLSEVSELLLRNKGCAWALATGIYNGRAYFSLRICPPRKNAAPIIQATVGDEGHGGGHAVAAGGVIIPVDKNPERAALEAIQRFLAYVGVDAVSERSICPAE